MIGAVKLVLGSCLGVFAIGLRAVSGNAGLSHVATPANPDYRHEHFDALLGHFGAATGELRVTFPRDVLARRFQARCL